MLKVILVVFCIEIKRVAFLFSVVRRTLYHIVRKSTGDEFVFQFVQ